MKNIVIIVLALLILGGGAYYFFVMRDTSPAEEVDMQVEEMAIDETSDESAMKEEAMQEGEEVIGKSVGGRDIIAYHFGNGNKDLLFVGGIHGGYSWNTSLVAYELIDYLEANPDVIPENVRVSVVPVLNPDGLHAVVGTDGRFSRADAPEAREDRVPGRFNANGVDLNRNFDCEWREEGVWQSRDVSGGGRAFSEPEARAIESYVEANEPDAVVVWYSAAGGVFASNCREGVPAETLAITNLFADASGYRAYEEFDFYEITGDMVNWLAKENIPAISVLLSTHTDSEWSKNRAGVEALLEYYAN